MSVFRPLPVSPPQSRCLVIQLAQADEVFQSLMALRAIKQLYPETALTVVVREPVAVLVRTVKWIDEVVSFPTETILGSGVTELAKWVKPLVQERWDLIANWSYSEASSFLTALLPAKVKLGYSRQKDVSFVCADGWSHFVRAFEKGGITQNIHRIDILTTQLLTAFQIHLGEGVQAGSNPVTSKDFFSFALPLEKISSLLLDPTKRTIAFQLDQKWGSENWIAFTLLLLRRHPDYLVLLLGEKEATALSDEIVAAMGRHPKIAHRVLNCVGQKTDYFIWAALISHCQWLISGDHAALHLASLLGTRVLFVADRDSRFVERGPYGNGHYVIVPHGMDGSLDCLVSPEAVYGAFAYASQEWIYRQHLGLAPFFQQLHWESELETVAVYRSSIRGPEKGGGLVFEPLIEKPLEETDWTAQFLGFLARSWYCGWVPQLSEELQREKMNPSLIQFVRRLAEPANALEKIFVKAVLISEQVQKKCASLKSTALMEVSFREELQALSSQLTALDAEAERLAQPHLPIRALVQISKALLQHLHGHTVYELSKEAAESYRQLRQGAVLLREWARFTLGLSKPKAVVHEAEIIPFHS